jgi:hypothetical protein
MKYREAERATKLHTGKGEKKVRKRKEADSWQRRTSP